MLPNEKIITETIKQKIFDIEGRKICQESKFNKSLDKEWETFLHGLNSFSDDFMAEGRSQGTCQKRENL